MSDADDPLVLDGVHKHYGAVRAVDGVSLRVARGELFGLIGHNGAGKSTLFKLMLGLIAPTEGSLRVAGGPVRGPAFRAARRRIGYLPENLVLYDNLSGLETLRFFARLKGADAAQCAPLLARVGLAPAADRAVREYSKGMRQRLGFAQALLGEPRLLFLDEPTTGLDPTATRDFYLLLDELRDQGVTLIVTSHVLAELQARVDRLAIMASGKVVAEGSVAELRARARLPLTLTVTAPASVLAALRAVAPDLTPTPQGARLTCAPEAKLALLAALAAVPGVADVQVQEPTLEDLFFGLEGAA